MTAPRLAFIGSPQSVSPWLLQSIARVGVFEALCCENADREVERVRARWGFENPVALLKEAEPEGVIVAMPFAERTRVIKQCLTGGAGVLVPGVPATSASCARLSTFAKLAGRFVHAVPAILHAPAVLLAKRLVDSGKLGNPISMTVESTRRGSARDDSPDNGPVPADQIYEAIVLVLHLLGPIQKIFAAVHPDGAMAVTMTASDGIPASLLFHSSGSPDLVGTTFAIRSSDGTRLAFDQYGGLVCRNGSKTSACHATSLASTEPTLELGYDGLIAEFRRHLETRTGSGLIWPAAQATAATEGILSSAQRGRATSPRKSGPLRPEKATPKAVRQ